MTAHEVLARYFYNTMELARVHHDNRPFDLYEDAVSSSSGFVQDSYIKAQQKASEVLGELDQHGYVVFGDHRDTINKRTI